MDLGRWNSEGRREAVRRCAGPGHGGGFSCPHHLTQAEVKTVSTSPSQEREEKPCPSWLGKVSGYVLPSLPMWPVRPWPAIAMTTRWRWCHKGDQDGQDCSQYGQDSAEHCSELGRLPQDWAGPGSGHKGQPRGGFPRLRQGRSCC